MFKKFLSFVFAGGLLMVGAGCTSGAAVNVDSTTQPAGGAKVDVNAAY